MKQPQALIPSFNSISCARVGRLSQQPCPRCRNFSVAREGETSLWIWICSHGEISIDGRNLAAIENYGHGDLMLSHYWKGFIHP